MRSPTQRWDTGCCWRRARPQRRAESAQKHKIAAGGTLPAHDRGPESDYDAAHVTDAGEAGLMGTKRSTMGIVVKLTNGPMFAKSARQTLITTSSTDAVYVAPNAAIKQTEQLLSDGALPRLELGFNTLCRRLPASSSPMIRCWRNSDLPGCSGMHVAAHTALELSCACLSEFLSLRPSATPYYLRQH